MEVVAVDSVLEKNGSRTDSKRKIATLLFDLLTVKKKIAITKTGLILTC
jgi:hypothetical protein